MEKFKILTEVSPWYIALCAMLALAYAALLYSRSGPWNKVTGRVLFATRFLVVFLICFLLTGPLIQLIRNYYEKPALVIAVDNSESLRFGMDSTALEALKKDIAGLASHTRGDGVEVEIMTLDRTMSPDGIDSLRFDARSTNLGAMLAAIETNYENRNLTGVVLLTDGIVNEGPDPLFRQYTFPVLTVGLGDTTSRRDVRIRNLLYNRIAYTGNKFPLIAEIQNIGFSGETIKVRLRQGSEILEEKRVPLGNASLVEAEFTIVSSKPGLRHYVVEVEPLEQEFTDENNRARAYVEVMDAREKILLAAAAPHPDIKALKSAIEQKDNYELSLYIPGMNTLKEDKYDLVILHQLPDQGAGSDVLTRKLNAMSSSSFYIVGNQSGLSRLNQVNGVLEIISGSAQKDLVNASLNNQFEKFKIDRSEAAVLSKYPPLIAPFGNISVRADADIALYQKVGSVVTDNPLLALRSESGKKTAVLTAEGIWQWRLEEYKATGATMFFDKLFNSLFQYLSSKEDKRKFRLAPVNDEMNENEPVVFDAWLYNDIYEPVYGKKITLHIKGEEGATMQYAFTTSEGKSTFEVRGLKPGLYSYSGNVEHDGRTHHATGEFLIREQRLEALNTRANHGMLRELALKTKGAFYEAGQWEELNARLSGSDYRPVIHSTEEFQEVIHLPWLLILMIILISIEWGIRKYTGGY